MQLNRNRAWIQVMAIESLATVLPNWYAWAEKAYTLPILQTAAYPFPKVTPKS